MKQYTETQIAIMSAFEKMLGEMRFKKISVQEILNRASISRSQFYRLFTDKYDYRPLRLARKCNLKGIPLAGQTELQKGSALLPDRRAVIRSFLWFWRTGHANLWNKDVVCYTY